MDITSNALKGMFCCPSKKYPIAFEIHPHGDNAEERQEASDDFTNIVSSICPRIEGDHIIVELHTRSRGY